MIIDLTKLQKNIYRLATKMDCAEHCGYDLSEIILTKHQYNESRPYKHGKKF